MRPDPASWYVLIGDQETGPLTRVELGPRSVAFKPVVFYDMGWAGDRSDWGHEGRPLAGAGAGMSFLDGLIRLDVAHAIYPGKSWRVNWYLNATF